MELQQFTEKFQNEFNKDTFYASPNRTKIHLQIGKEQVVVGNAVVVNVEQLNEKIPIYSYNSTKYRKYLQGKEVVTGIVALRKVTVTQFIKLIKRERSKSVIEQKIKELEDDIQELKSITINKDYEIVESNNEEKLELRGLNKIINTRIATLNKLKDIFAKKDYDDSSLKDIFERIDGGKSIDSSTFKEDDLLYYIETYSQNLEKKEENGNKAKIKISFEGSFGDNCPQISVENILFTRKQTEINIGKNDIVEVYHFIGNPK